MEIAEARRREVKLFKLDGWNPASVQPVEAPAARLLARPILREYVASTVVELAGIPPPSNLWKRLLLVRWLGRSCRRTTLSTVDEIAMHPANHIENFLASRIG